MNKGLLAGIIVLVAFVVVIGGYYGYGEYKSMTYNDLMKQVDGSDGSIVQARNAYNEINETTKSYETNINNVKKGMELTDQSINGTKQMMDIAPDEATFEYARIRNSQFIIMKNVEELVLRLFEEMQSGNIFTAAAYAETMNTELTNLEQQMDTEQTALVNLVNSNPELKERMISNLGESRTNEILTS